MKKFLLFLLLPVFLLAACDQEDGQVLVATDYPEVALDIKPLSWTTPYLGKQKVIFENYVNQQAVFLIEETPRTYRKTYFSEELGETFTLVLRSENNSEQVFAFSPNGDEQFSFATVADLDPYANTVFDLSYAPLDQTRLTYWAQWGFRDNLLSDATYEFGSLYPASGDDRFSIELNPAAAHPFLQQLVMQQGRGIVQFTDHEGIVWTQVEIQ
jgi:hypothetical protein